MVDKKLQNQVDKVLAVGEAIIETIPCTFDNGDPKGALFVTHSRIIYSEPGRGKRPDSFPLAGINISVSGRVAKRLNINGREFRVDNANNTAQHLQSLVHPPTQPAPLPQPAQGSKPFQGATTIIREIVKIPCGFCGALVEITATTCPVCKANIK